MANQRIKGLKQNARSPGSITNVEHYDEVGAEKSISGTPLAYNADGIVADSTVPTALQNHDIIRVFNTDTAVAYLWVGKEDEVPGTVDITTGAALIPQFTEVIYVGVSDDCQKSLMFKSSAATVQVIKMKQ